VADARPRQIAFRALQRAAAGDFIEHRLEADPGFNALAPQDRRLAQEIVYGVLRHRSALDWIIQQSSDGRPQRPEVQDALRMGLYQLFWLDRIPAHAAVHESVDLIRASSAPAAAGFVNAILRNCERNRAEVLADLARLRDQDPATGWSHPAWLVDRWRSRFGPAGLRRLLEWNNSPPPTCARVNTLKTSTPALLERWAAEGVSARAIERPWIPTGIAFELLSHPALNSLASFKDGCFYIQDPSTLFAVAELDARPGESILDWCAAPGGKATFIAQLTQNAARVIAHDNSVERLRLVSENALRLGASGVHVAGPPAAPGALGSFDRVLLDAPCSNTGVLRRRLELRWRIQRAEIDRLASTQCSLIERAAAFVRPGGTLVYSTCSLETEENEAVVDAFLSQHAGWSLVRRRTLDPVKDGVDGAHVAVLRRASA